MKNSIIINIENYTDERGTLVPFEYNKNCPFEIKRTFCIYGVPNGVIRGKHTNIISNHLLVCITGKCKIKCMENDEEEVFVLDTPNKALYIKSNVYKEMYDFSEDSILLVLSDTNYMPEEYVER